MARGQMSQKAEVTYTVGEEVAHATSHGVGAVLSIIALVLMVLKSGGLWQVLAASVFGVSLVVLYTSSTLYHALPWPQTKNTLRIFDHVAIYLLIAGSYTPFALVTLGGTLGWSLFALVWTIALAGSAFEIMSRGKKWKVALFFYLAMGWLAIFFIKPLAELLSPWGITLLFTGGVLYSVGTIFYAWKKLPYNHVVWHLFVLGGSVAHFLCIINCVLIA